MNIFKEYLKELTTIEPMDFYIIGMFSIILSIRLYKDYIDNKKNYVNSKEIQFFDINIVDNDAQWVYDGKIYYSKIVNGKVDYKNVKEISI